MSEKRVKLSSFKDNFIVHPDWGKQVAWKKNDDVFVDKKSVKYLLTSLTAITNSNTKSISGKIKLSDYDKDKQMIKYNNIVVPVHILQQLERVWTWKFGQY